MFRHQNGSDQSPVFMDLIARNLPILRERFPMPLVDFEDFAADVFLSVLKSLVAGARLDDQSVLKIAESTANAYKRKRSQLRRFERQLLVKDQNGDETSFVNTVADPNSLEVDNGACSPQLAAATDMLAGRGPCSSEDLHLLETKDQYPTRYARILSNFLGKKASAIRRRLHWLRSRMKKYFEKLSSKPAVGNDPMNPRIEVEL